MTTPTPAPQPERPPEPDWRLLWADDEAKADRRKASMTPAELKRTVFMWEERA